MKQSKRKSKFSDKGCKPIDSFFAKASPQSELIDFSKANIISDDCEPITDSFSKLKQVADSDICCEPPIVAVEVEIGQNASSSNSSPVKDYVSIKKPLKSSIKSKLDINKQLVMENEDSSSTETDEDIPLAVIKRSPMKLAPIKKQSTLTGLLEKTKKGQKFKSPSKVYPVVTRLKRAISDNSNSASVKKWTTLAANTLTKEQINKLKDDDIKKMVLERKDDLLLKKKIKAMSEEERKAYFAQKRQEKHRERTEKMKQLNKRYEDTLLTSEKSINTLLTVTTVSGQKLHPSLSTVLPEPEPVVLPPSLPSSAFGDAVFVMEFIHAYRGLLIGNTKATDVFTNFKLSTGFQA